MPVEPFDPMVAAVPAGTVHDVLRVLRSSALEPLGVVTEASNATFLCRVDDAGDDVFAIYKPEAGERPLWDFPPGLYRREVAAFHVSEQLGWDVVPPTVLRDGPAGPGSVQLFVPHDPEAHYFELVAHEEHHPELARLALFDLLINNADRKGGHVLLGARDGRIYGIDNGLCFHAEPKLRTVIWELGGFSLERVWRDALARLAAVLPARGGTALTGALGQLLEPSEISALRRRAGRLQDVTALPAVPEHRRAYPWPPL